MLINILSDHRDFVLNLYESAALLKDEQTAEAEITVEEPSRVTGAFEGWYEIAVTLGIIGIPVSIFANLLSSWIWESYLKSKDSGISIKLYFEKEDGILELELNNLKSLEEIRESLQKLGSDDVNE